MFAFEYILGSCRMIHCEQKIKISMENLKKAAAVATNVSKPECKWSCCWKKTKYIPHKHPPEGWEQETLWTRLLLVEMLEHIVSLARCSVAEMDFFFFFPSLLVWRLLMPDWSSISILLPKDAGGGDAPDLERLKHLQQWKQILCRNCQNSSVQTPQIHCINNITAAPEQSFTGASVLACLVASFPFLFVMWCLCMLRRACAHGKDEV